MLGTIQDTDIKLLRMFHVIVECGGFTAAQARLDISQSAISTQMAHLEVRLGCRLCERGRGNFELTDDGRAVLNATKKLFTALEDFRSEVLESQGKLAGELRLGLIDNTVTHDNALIHDAIAGFIRQAPEATLSMYVGSPVDLEQQIVDGRLHLAVGLFHHRLASIEYLPLIEEVHALYCAKSHPLFQRADADVSKEDIQQADYVGWGYTEALRGWEAPCDFNELASSPHIEAVAYLILSGRYLGYLPTHYAEQWVRNGDLRPLQMDDLRRSSRFSLIKRKSANLPRLATVFMQHLGVADGVG